MGGCGHGKEGATKRANDGGNMFPQHPHPPPSAGVPSLLSPTLCCDTPLPFSPAAAPLHVQSTRSLWGCLLLQHIGLYEAHLLQCCKLMACSTRAVPWVVAVCWVLLPGNVIVTMMWPSCVAPAQSNPLLLASQSCENTCEHSV